MADCQVIFSSETSKALKEHPTNDIICSFAGSMWLERRSPGIAHGYILLYLHCAILGVFKTQLESSPKKSGLSSMLSLCWAGGWTRWFPEVPSTSPSHLCHSTDVTLPRDASKTVQSFYLDLLYRDLGRAIPWNFAVAFNAPHLSGRVCQFDREHPSCWPLWQLKF